MNQIVINKIEDIISLCKKYRVNRIYAFGSVCGENFTAKSDIDFLVDFEPEQKNFDNYMAVYDIFESLFKNEKIELVTKNGLSKYIGPKILNEVVYV